MSPEWCSSAQHTSSVEPSNDHVVADKPSRHRCRWTAKEDMHLQLHWGDRSPILIARDLQRTRRAVTNRAQVLGLAANEDGDRTLTAFARYSGFSRTKVQNAATAIGVKLKQGLRTRAYGRSKTRARATSVKSQRWYIPSEREDELLSYLLANQGQRIQLKRGRWGSGSLPAACLGCERNDLRHYAKGRCRSCYDQHRTGS